MSPDLSTSVPRASTPSTPCKHCTLPTLFPVPDQTLLQVKQTARNHLFQQSLHTAVHQVPDPHKSLPGGIIQLLLLITNLYSGKLG